ncbi:hypothetical protein NOVO_05450 [Rickettsiales bacterium Ac37b]|nr:hypothetical protein NOVO_05450 [Rickettsiales bacterium Ac37b]
MNKNYNINYKECGNRIKQARILAGFVNKKDFCLRYNISINTLQSWELGRTPLTKKGARRICEALLSDGFYCSIEWLLYGVGHPPSVQNIVSNMIHELFDDIDLQQKINIEDEMSLFKEKECFKSLHPKAIIMVITDDGMEPFYKIGDYVAGIPLDDSMINIKLHNKHCIIRTHDDILLVRSIQSTNKDGIYNICTLNPATTVFPVFINEVKLSEIAPIIWYRKIYKNVFS